MLQLHPWALQLLNAPLRLPTADRIFPLRTVLPNLDSILAGYEGQPEQTVMTIVENQLSPAVAGVASSLLERACRRWQRATGMLPVSELSQQLRCSSRLLEKQFKQFVGLTPKEFTTVLRLRALVDTWRIGSPGLSLAQVALEYGFYDQAHFSNVFRRMMQRTPAQFDLMRCLLPIDGPGY